MKRIQLLAPIALVLFTMFSPDLSAQDSRGTEFFVGFMRNINTPGNLVLFLTGATATTGTVEIPGLAFSAPFTITPGTITSVPIPSTARHSGSNTTENKGIRVSALAPIALYGLNQASNTTDAYLGLPRTLLGTDHIVLGYNGGAGGPSEFQIIGTVDGTQVIITPSVAGTGRAAGVPYVIILNRLQSYQLEATGATTDLSGTLISSTQPLALFGGAVCTNIPDNGTLACDHVVEQIPATGAWGQNFLTASLATRTAGDIFRVIARDNGTQVTLDGVLVATLNKGQIYQTSLASNTRHTIVASAPVLVAQYCKGQTADNVLSDPFMMLIQPTEQFQTSYTLTTPAATPVAFTNFINVVAQAGTASQCRIDGNPFSAAFNSISGTTYVAALQSVTLGTHNLTCPDPFAAYSYGYASADSYGYPGGLGLRFIAAPRCDVNNDGIISLADINLIFAARNQPASGPEDQRDFDGDLTITVADARACQQRCTNAGCAAGGL